MRHLIAILAICFVALTACSDKDDGDKSDKFNPPQIKNRKPGRGGILVMGDSLAYGYGASATGMTPERCFSRHFPGKSFNYAVNGYTTSDLMGHLQKVLPPHLRNEKLAPAMIFVSIGGNDALLNRVKEGRYPERKTMEEISRLFDQLLATKALVVYLALNPPYSGLDRLQKISHLARLKGILTVDAMGGLWKNNEYMSDLVHPNDRGYDLMCQRIVQAVTPHYP